MYSTDECNLGLRNTVALQNNVVNMCVTHLKKLCILYTEYIYLCCMNSQKHCDNFTKQN